MCVGWGMCFVCVMLSTCHNVHRCGVMRSSYILLLLFDNADARNGDVVPVLPVTERGKEDEEAPVIVDQPPAAESNKSDGDDMSKEGETKPNLGNSDRCEISSVSHQEHHVVHIICMLCIYCSTGSVSGSPSIGDYDRPGSVIFYQGW